jgi:hypothetical protein
MQNSVITGELKDILGHLHLRKYVAGAVKRKNYRDVLSYT